MNLKELILFGMEESQELVIKNPILQAALREPRPMTQGGPVGNPTGMITEYGRKVYETPGGEKVSEKSVTLQINLDSSWTTDQEDKGIMGKKRALKHKHVMQKNME